MSARTMQYVRVFAATAILALAAGALPVLARPLAQLGVDTSRAVDCKTAPDTPGCLPTIGGGGAGGSIKTSLDAAVPPELKNANSLPVIINGIISSLLGLLGVVLLVYLLYGGFTWMTAGGEEKKVKEATQIIRNAIVGIAIIAMSYVIASFVVSQLGAAVG